MAITDYKARSKQYLNAILANPDISQVNKEALKRFMLAYDVSPARETIFLSHIERFLKRTPDIEKDMHNSDKISAIFKEIKEEYSLATADTIKAVSMAFCKWLNDGEKPKGFKHLKRSRKDQMRDLNADDMVSWEEGKKIASRSVSVQIKAAFLTQLDCGFRPSEFLGLDYGDVSIDGDIVIFQVREGKTGKRQVWMHRAVPAFLSWYDTHPTKKKSDPLWVMENTNRSHPTTKEEVQKIERYNYHALLKRFKWLFKSAEIDKPTDFYNLRHSSCALDKLDNVPLDEAAARHGHSVKYFVETYGRLNIEGTLARVRQHYGKPEEKKALLKNLTCERCKVVNTPEAEYCRGCGAPLTAATAAKVHSEALEMKDRLAKIEKALVVLARASPSEKREAEELAKVFKKKK